MIRIEIKTVIELPNLGPTFHDLDAPQQILQLEIERVAEDPLAYQQSHECDVKITSCLLDGPIASAYAEKIVAYRDFLFDRQSSRTLEPAGFPAI